MDVAAQFKKYITSNNLFKKDSTILVAVSGGLDSIVLCDLLHKAKQRFAIAHINYQLRGEESNGDADFVKQMAAAYNVQLYYTTCDTLALAEKEKTGIQETARVIRYAFFEEVRRNESYHCIATAHHADDNIESVMLHMIRGTGLKGLQGILPKNGKIVRPLLFAYKDDLLHYANENNLTWREDSSNATDHYLRNKLRHNVVPEIENVQPDFKSIFTSNIRHWQDAYTLYAGVVDKLSQKCISKADDGMITIDTAVLRKGPTAATILYEMIQPYGFNSTQAHDIFASLSTTESNNFHSATHKIIKDRYKLYITQVGVITSVDTFHVNIDTKEVDVNGVKLYFSTATGNAIQQEPENILMQLDADKLQFPLLLRPWKQGDYLYPLGMKMKKKKVSDLLTDRKVSAIKKKNLYVLLSGEKIAAVIGLRLDERFKVTPATQNVLKIRVV